MCAVSMGRPEDTGYLGLSLSTLVPENTENTLTEMELCWQTSDLSSPPVSALCSRGPIGICGYTWFFFWLGT